MANAVEVIEAVGQLGAVAAISSIIAVAVAQSFDLKRIDKLESFAQGKEEREAKRLREQALRDNQLKWIMEVQDMMWPLQEQASIVQRVSTGLDELATARPRIPTLLEEQTKYSTMNNRVEVLISRIMDEELEKSAETCRADVYFMISAVPVEEQVDQHREAFKNHYYKFQTRAKTMIRELMV